MAPNNNITTSIAKPLGDKAVRKNNTEARITRSARRKSANDGVVMATDLPKVSIPEPMSTRKPNRPPVIRQLRRNMKEGVDFVTPSTAEITTPVITDRTTGSEEEMYTVAPKVSSDDDDNDQCTDSCSNDLQMSTVNECYHDVMLTPVTNDDNNNHNCATNGSHISSSNNRMHISPVEITALTAEQMNIKMHQLYLAPTSNSSGSNNDATANWNHLIFHRPCVSARLFACFLLWSEQTATDTNLKLNIEVQRILPLLFAMVHVEAISLESDTTTADDDTISKPVKKRKQTPKKLPHKIHDMKQRKVHFLSLDGSSIRPPIDRDLQSGARQQQSIETMTHAKVVIEGLTSDAISSLHLLQTYLSAVQSQANDDASNIMQLCASSISNEYSLKLVRETVNIILSDLITLHERLTSECRKPLQLEVRLAEHLGQAIRYQLRRLFNPAPPRLCSLDANYDIRALTYSQVHQLMTMNKRATIGLAVDDGFLSALISRALCRLYEYFDLEHMIPISEFAYSLFLTIIPSDFCTSAPSLRQISPRIRSNGDELTENDRDLVIADIQQAASFLAATYAARFLCDVFTTPGVQEEVQRMGGWSSIEQYASTSKKYELYESCPADAHLVPMCDYAALLQRLQMLCTHMEPKTQLCIDALTTVAKNYHIPSPTSPTKTTRKLHHYVEDIVNTYHDMIMEVDAFPQVVQSPPVHDDK